MTTPTPINQPAALTPEWEAVLSRLRSYSKDWSARAGSVKPVAEAIEVIEAQRRCIAELEAMVKGQFEREDKELHTTIPEGWRHAVYEGQGPFAGIWFASVENATGTYQADSQCSGSIALSLALIKAALAPTPPDTTAGEIDEVAELFIDCEFNGGRGELISMALVAADGREFYEVLPLPSSVQPWVAQNVVPILGKEPISQTEFYNRLFAFLDQFECPSIVADHAADLAYFANALIVDTMGRGYKKPWRAERRTLPDGYQSKTPHNALEDARAICRTVARHPRSKSAAGGARGFL